MSTDLHKYDVNTGCNECITNCQALHNKRSGPKRCVFLGFAITYGNTHVAASSDMKYGAEMT